MISRTFLAAMAGLAMVIAIAGPTYPASAGSKSKYEVAVFAGGCFWCVESDFDKVPGVVSTISGFAGGEVKNPTYMQVVRGGTGHREAVKITYNPRVVSYKRLLDIFWRSIDPTDGGGQFCDRGFSYTTAVFARNASQLRIARKSKAALQAAKRLPGPIVTAIVNGGRFYPAEKYHQNFYRKSPLRYTSYRYGCRRDARVRALWGKEAHGGIPHS